MVYCSLNGRNRKHTRTLVIIKRCIFTGWSANLWSRQQILKLPAAKDADNHNYAEKSRDKISDKTDSRITEDKRFYPGGYDHGAANNQGGENNGKRKTIADIIQTFLQAAQIFMPEPDIQVTLFNFLQNTLNSTRQIALQLEIKT